MLSLVPRLSKVHLGCKGEEKHLGYKGGEKRHASIFPKHLRESLRELTGKENLSIATTKFGILKSA